MSPSWEEELAYQLEEKANRLLNKGLFCVGIRLKTSTEELTKHIVVLMARCKERGKIKKAFKKMIAAARGGMIIDYDVWDEDYIPPPTGQRIDNLEELPDVIAKLRQEVAEEVMPQLPPKLRKDDVLIDGNYIYIDVYAKSQEILYYISGEAPPYMAEVLAKRLYQIAKRIDKTPELYLSRKTGLKVVDVNEEEEYVWCA